MNAITLTQEQRQFVTELLSLGLTKEDPVSVALGRVIANNAQADASLPDMVAINAYVKDYFVPHARDTMSGVTELMPLNVSEVEKNAKNFFIMRLSIANGLTKYIRYSSEDTIVRGLGVTYPLNKKVLTMTTSEQGIDYFNGFSDLLTPKNEG